MSKPSPPPQQQQQQQPQLQSPTAAATTTSATSAATALPVLESVDASILVPIQPADLIPPNSSSSSSHNTTTTTTTTTTNTDRLHAIIAGLASHHAAVRANITSLVRQECARIVLDTRAREASIPIPIPTPQQQQPPQPPPPTRRAAPEDLDAMIANMRSKGDTLPPGPDLADKATATSSKESRLIESVIPWPPDGTPREDCARNIMVTLDRGLVELASFDGHAAKTRLFYETALQREAARDAEQESANQN